MLTQSRLKEVVNYNPETGLFIWKIYRKRSINGIGGLAEVNQRQGYKQVSIDGKLYLAHRLAWFYMTGEWPKELIDHKDGVKHNNKWENLREATKSQNRYNVAVHKNNIVGTKGVYKTKDGRFRVLIGLGTFNTLEEASNTYKEAAKKLHGEFYKE